MTRQPYALATPRSPWKRGIRQLKAGKRLGCTRAIVVQETGLRCDEAQFGPGRAYGRRIQRKKRNTKAAT